MLDPNTSELLHLAVRNLSLKRTARLLGVSPPTLAHVLSSCGREASEVMISTRCAEHWGELVALLEARTAPVVAELEGSTPALRGQH